MKKLITSFVALALAVLGLGVVAAPAYAVETGSASTYIDVAAGEAGVDDDGLSSTIGTIISFALGVIGVLCVVIIIVGGVTYTTSQGDSAKVAKATKTILYGVVGLVVCLLAFAIVNFVLSGISGS